MIEVKTVEALFDVHLAQVFTYLKLLQCKLGLLMNLKITKKVDGIKRVVNKL